MLHPDVSTLAVPVDSQLEGDFTLIPLNDDVPG